jgi:hypothetical protein
MKHGNETFYFQDEGLVEAPLLPEELFREENGLEGVFPLDLKPKPGEQVPKPTRIFCRLFEKGVQPDAEGLIKLGSIMETEQPEDITNNLDSNIPAGYTYLGQFIDHDITLMRNTGLIPVGTVKPGDIKNLRTPSLDLDSLYLDGPNKDPKHPKLYDDSDGRTFRIGETRITDKEARKFYNDLLRDDPLPKAIIGDARNDENLAVAQTHLAFLKYHNAFAKANPSKSFEELRHEVTLHYQAIILTDFLPRILDRDVLKDVLQNGRRFYTDEKKDCMPIEFSVAAYRLGHSMVRPSYQFNRFHNSATLNELFKFSGGSGDLFGVPPLPSEWIIDWRRFYELPELPEGMQLNFSRKLDTNIASPLKELPQFSTMNPKIPKPFLSLATRNLLRGRLVSLPSGQEVARAIREKVDTAIGETDLTPDQILDLGNHRSDEVKILKKYNFDKVTPLWYYILREAMVQGDGNHLGKVGSRIVAETFVGLIQNSSINVINKQPGLRFSMPELLQKIPFDINPLGDD